MTLVRTLLATAALAAAPLAATTASAAPFIDQSQTVDSGAWGRLNTSTSWGESFKPGSATSVGAGFFIERFGSTPSGDVTISLLTAPLTSAGATVLAKGTTSATQGSWADVTWDAVTLAVGSTYYLYASSPTALFVAYGDGDTYPGGQLYGNTTPYGGYYDLTFRTFADTAAAATGAAPEPASWAMMILGMGMVGYALRRRKGKDAGIAFG